MAELRRLSLDILKYDVIRYIRENYKSFTLFSAVELLFLFVVKFGLNGVGTLWFLLWIAMYYVFNFVMFRYLLGKEPYCFTKKFFDTLIPASKILFGIMVILTLLAHLPYLPLLFVGASEQIKNIVTEFIGDFMGESNVYNLLVSMILLLCSPVILYRPMMAWISAVIGRSGLFKNAFKKTEGYYVLFLGILAFFYLLVLGTQFIDAILELQGYLFWFLCAPIAVFFSLVLAKTYEFLFLN